MFNVNLKLGIHEKAKLCRMSQDRFFPPILVEKLGKAFADVPKFVLRQGSKSQNSCHPYSFSPTRAISSFISSLDTRSQSRQNYCFPASLASRSQIGMEFWILSTFEFHHLASFAPNFIGFLP
ncbi:hypothetical protein AVEN_37118-1 [Araneus ventricosus]|uniref:Uncharacterized protein n=1 Tax=Araneus ventricosus TaxID=182803 RepID=A0A4Y2FTZ8_ARAVE|nr:hypothetical protein AVEN_37118-1 [Araneus ventricosus]